MANIRMDLQFFAGEKTEKATPQKKRESRKKGQVAKSGELPSSIIFLLMFILFYMLGPYLSEHIIGMYQNILTSYLTWDVTADNVRLLFLQLLSDMLWVIIPIFLIALVGGISGNLVQIGFLFTGEPIQLKLERLNPLEGAKKIFSKRALFELLKSLLKIFLVGYVAFSTIIAERKILFSLFQYSLTDILTFVGQLFLKIGIKTSILLIVLAIMDYLYQKFDYEKNLRMSKQDIKDEHKKSEGDPLIKGKIKEKQRQMAMGRMMQAIPDADVVITNPTHFAVVIKYNPEEMQAPMLVAKGMDYIALKIKEVAKEHDVVTIENKWLARNLYFQVDIEEPIPTELFHAVAEVLAYVYRIKGMIK